MSFYVVMSNGERFGPADLSALNDWIQEGRVVQTTTLQNTLTGELFLARDVAGLVWVARPTTYPDPAGTVTPGPYSNLFGGQQASPGQPGVTNNPYGAAPMQPGQPGRFTGVSAQPDNGDKEAGQSFVLSLVTLLCVCCPLIAFGALWLGYTARSKGSMQSGPAIALAWFAVIVSIALWLSLSAGGFHSPF